MTKSYEENCMDVFAYIIKYGDEDQDALSKLITVGNDRLFLDDWYGMFQLILKYYRLTGKVLKQDEFVSLIESFRALPVERKTRFVNMFSELLIHDVKKGAFQFYMSQLSTQLIFDRSSVMLENANQALMGQIKMGKDVLHGYNGMRRILLDGMCDVDKVIAEYTPEGNVNEERNQVLEEYDKLSIAPANVVSGYYPVDNNCVGFFPGELWLLVGYAGEGKTFMCINIGHDVVYRQGKNVVFMTSETVRTVVRRRLVARHSKYKFGFPLDLTAWKKGKLIPEAHVKLKETVEDMNSINSKYGIFYLAQIPANGTTDYILSMLTKLESQFHIDLVILDSIHLLKPKRIRQSSYMELDDMLIETKKLIIGHNNGKGVPLLSPWHVNRLAWEKAKEMGYYTKSALAKSSEAERQADVIVSILKPEQESNSLKGSILKNRDGGELPEFWLLSDFRYGCILNDLKMMTSAQDDSVLREV